MKSDFSKAVPPATTLGMFCVIFCPWNKIRLLHAPTDVVNVVRSVVDKINGIKKASGPVKTSEKEKLGAINFTMDGNLFQELNSKESATMGKLLCICLLEELFKVGYELDLSSDLSRSSMQASTLFFRKTASGYLGAYVMCVAPGKTDRITLLNHDVKIKNAVEEAIKDTWPEGIDRQKDINVLGQNINEIKMNGLPWSSASASETNIENNRIINKIVENLSKLNLQLLAGINIKGGTDSLFFIADPGRRLSWPPNAQFASISLCRFDRLRLIDCKEEADGIRQTMIQNDYKIQDESLKEHHAKFQLQGTPWSCSGMEAVRARQLISRISEKMLQSGWALTDAIDITRREHDKSMLMFRRCAPTEAKFSCFALTSTNHLRFVDFPSKDVEVLKKCLTDNYLPGFIGINTSKAGHLTATLNGSPWSHPASMDLGWALHARSLLCHLLANAIRLGYRIVASADISAKHFGNASGAYPMDVHTIYMVKLPENGEQNAREKPPSYLAATMFHEDKN